MLEVWEAAGWFVVALSIEVLETLFWLVSVVNWAAEDSLALAGVVYISKAPDKTIILVIHNLPALYNL